MNIKKYNYTKIRCKIKIKNKLLKIQDNLYFSK